jgi:hypothetical protein
MFYLSKITSVLTGVNPYLYGNNAILHFLKFIPPLRIRVKLLETIVCF